MSSTVFDGVWKTEGYNLIYEIRKGTITIYEITDVSGLKIVETEVTTILQDYELELLDNKCTLLIKSRYLLHRFTAHFIPYLPEVCMDGGTPPTKDPIVNFEIFWQTMYENFAHFATHDVDWLEVYKIFRPLITPHTSEEELFDLLVRMIQPIRDRHTSIHKGHERGIGGGIFPEWMDPIKISHYFKFLYQHLYDGTGANGDGDEILFSEYLSVIRTNYLMNQVKYACNKVIFYGQIGNRIGYISILRMSYFRSSIPEAITELTAFIEQIISKMEHLPVIIVDVRFNPGNWDRFAFIVANRFADTRRIAYTKQARDKEEFTPLQTFYVEPEGARQYRGRVFVLTSGHTCSGIEVFVMAMTALPNVTVVGEPTAGCHSDTLDRHLPNGWQFSLSNEIYRVHGTNIAERVGLIPDHVVYLDKKGFELGIDNILEETIRLSQPY